MVRFSLCCHYHCQTCGFKTSFLQKRFEHMHIISLYNYLVYRENEYVWRTTEMINILVYLDLLGSISNCKLEFINSRLMWKLERRANMFEHVPNAAKYTAYVMWVISSDTRMTLRLLQTVYRCRWLKEKLHVSWTQQFWLLRKLLFELWMLNIAAVTRFEREVRSGKTEYH